MVFAGYAFSGITSDFLVGGNVYGSNNGRKTLTVLEG